jgi:hypothetical protein
MAASLEAFGDNHAMRERLSRRRLFVVAVGVATLVVSAKLLHRDHPRDPCQTPAAAPAAQIALLPTGLSLDRVGTVTRVVQDRLNVVVQAITTRPIDDVTILIQDAVTAAGYRPAGMDNEGFEAEVFFTAGSYAGGQALVRHSACKGRWNIHLVLLDRRATPPRVTTGIP